ncbi:hypothetical protein VIBNIAM115_500039 [Vibrio nigripulchritudo AM115]|nr:hypothetical protein VIBNIAM115_500039 [Vibrio nigripulchritudo AM115]
MRLTPRILFYKAHSCLKKIYSEIKKIITGSNQKNATKNATYAL